MVRSESAIYPQGASPLRRQGSKPRGRSYSRFRGSTQRCLHKGTIMGLMQQLLGSKPRQQADEVDARQAPQLGVECLESRTLLDATATLAGNVLNIVGGPNRDHIAVLLDQTTNELVVFDSVNEVFRVASAAVTTININGLGGNDLLRIDANITQTANLFGGAGKDTLVAGAGTTNLSGGTENDTLYSGPGGNILDGDGGNINRFLDIRAGDVVVPNPGNRIFAFFAPPVVVEPILLANEVSVLLQRAAAASASNDAIIAIVDRGGRVLGVRVEGGVSTNITGNVFNLVFAIDGAIAKARTAAFFANNNAPLTSRTVQFISQSTITQRMVESNPSITDVNSPFRGPGFVAPIGLGGHFPPGIPFTPQVDLFAIEHTNRDSTFHPGADHIKGGANGLNQGDDIPLAERFNVDPAFIPASIPANQHLVAPDSFGFTSGLLPGAQNRGIATLPGGIPIFKNGFLVGGIGVFFPGTTGYANEENSALSADYDPARPDRSLEAEYIAFAAVGGSSSANLPVGTINGVPALPGFDLPSGRIDLVGITLDIFGPGGLKGPTTLVSFGQTLGVGDPNSGANQDLNGGGTFLMDGTPVPSGWLVTPHDGVGITAAQVTQIINQGIAQATLTRAAIRLPLGSRTAMVFAVADSTGEVLGLFRMPDATIFSIDVAVAKSRNTAYYADANTLQAIDQLPGIPAGTAFTNRTFRYAAEPRFPEGIDGKPPGPMSVLQSGGANLVNGLNVGAPLPASAFQTFLGYDAFFPQTNFHDPNNITNQNGVVWFPGSAPLYSGGTLIGGFGVSGDGVDQDDVVTFIGTFGFGVPATVLRSDQTFFTGVRLPYQKFLRNPEG
ncbi:MAG: heme-binding protein [Gemmataceae bacterium]